jgi:GTP:adenosylcobinamide-phosphate guanylyltransferase
VLVEVRDAESARSAEQQGAEGVVLRLHAEGIRDATALPLVWHGSLDEATDADAVVVDVERERERLADVVEEVQELGIECVVKVRDEDDLEHVLELLDPEILLLSADEVEDDKEHLEHLLELLPDVPAGKLAIAELTVPSRDDVAELERAGVDAVLVAVGDIGLLVGGPPPEV